MRKGLEEPAAGLRPSCAFSGLVAPGRCGQPLRLPVPAGSRKPPLRVGCEWRVQRA